MLKIVSNKSCLCVYPVQYSRKACARLIKKIYSFTQHCLHEYFSTVPELLENTRELSLSGKNNFNPSLFFYHFEIFTFSIRMTVSVTQRNALLYLTKTTFNNAFNVPFLKLYIIL